MEFSFDREASVFMNSDREVSDCLNSNFLREKRVKLPLRYMFLKEQF